jgi:hypothetical protein
MFSSALVNQMVQTSGRGKNKGCISDSILRDVAIDWGLCILNARDREIMYWKSSALRDAMSCKEGVTNLKTYNFLSRMTMINLYARFCLQQNYWYNAHNLCSHYTLSVI